MPKEPETVDRFRITAEVDPTELGPMLASLAKMGLQNIGYELVTDVLNYKNRQHTIDGYNFALAWAQERQAFKLNEMGRYFKESGRGQSSANYHVGRMVENGVLKSLGNGYYQRADVMALPAPAQSEVAPGGKVHARTGKPAHRFEMNGEEAIWRHVKNRKKSFKTEELRTLFTAQGRTPNSVSPCLDKMMKAKLIKRVESGVYQVTGAKPKKAEATDPKKRAVAKGTVANLSRERYAVSNRDLIMNHVKGRKSFAAAEISELFANEKRPEKSASSLLSQLVKTKWIAPRGGKGSGEYDVIKASTINGTGAGEHANG